MTSNKKKLYTTNKSGYTYQSDDIHYNSQYFREHFPNLCDNQNNDARLQNGTNLQNNNQFVDSQNTVMAKIYTTTLANTLQNAVVVSKSITRPSKKIEISGGAPLISANAAGPSPSAHLIVSFKIAGLDDNMTTTATASADVTAVYACINRSGNFPNDLKKAVVSGPVKASVRFTSGKIEQVTRTLTIYLPALTLECPLGQEMVLVSASYTNVQVSEPHTGTVSIEGIFERTNFEI
ncbi:hypothetical protein CN326_09160 [Bacillus sp. AFS018417]|uniref:hypothetical protein n=1 Tax=unclassified Bacillus (in: firmicutes) TaxID=185979 RepID=UPI000BF950F3|nr:hypothetical protein [Bacillus sp. AFS018417]PEZ07302.1 hypothetical protein CN326_09160 [Bacillus sp. AFS018417]